MSHDSSTVAIQKYWVEIRQGRHVKSAPKAQPKSFSVRGARLPSKLAEHRAWLEHDRLPKSTKYQDLMRAAAKEFDRWNEKDKGHRGRKYGKPARQKRSRAA